MRPSPHIHECQGLAHHVLCVALALFLRFDASPCVASRCGATVRPDPPVRMRCEVRSGGRHVQV